MRTTLNTIYGKIQTNLGKITKDMSRINDQISSGQQMSKISEEPVNLVSALRFRSSIIELDQYAENIQNGNTIITAAESALTEMKEISLRAKTLAIQATDPAYGTANREAIAAEVKNLFEQSVYLANTQINGKYIFGGFRTTGYTDQEPAPFIIDQGDGHWINGVAPTAMPSALTSGAIDTAASLLAALPPVTGLAAGDLLINGVDIGVVDLTTVPDVAGINMTGASNLVTSINTAVNPPVTATLTTLLSGVASGGAAGGEAIDFTLNGVRIAYTAATGGAAAAAQEAVDRINAAGADTGVTALLGNGSNGGPANSVVLHNTLAGDASAITLAGLNAGETAVLGLSDLSQGADNTHNTGQVSLASSAAYAITTSSNDDTILAMLGLDGGGVGNYDETGDGELVFGYPLTSGELTINGIEVPAPTTDGLSEVYADASAAAKAAAINTLQPQTGVTAVVINAETRASSPVTAGTEPQRPTGVVTNTVIRAGDLAINGTALTTEISGGGVVNGLNMGKAANAKTAIDQESLLTRVTGRLTTLLPNNTTAITGGSTHVTFQVNGIDIDLTTGGISGHTTGSDVVAAINAVKGQTGVEARLGDGENGGVSDAIVLYNSTKGNEDAIVVTGLDSPAEDFLGLANNGPLGQGADATHNTGEISLDSKFPITITSPTTSPGADTIINELGFSSQNVTGFGGHTSVTATVTGVSITAPNSLYVNGVPTADIIGGAPTNGINMDMAAAAKAQIEAADPAVQVQLTTLTQGTAAASDATQDSEIRFLVNGELVNVAYQATALAGAIAASTIQAINAVTIKTGVLAYIGTGTADGSPAGSAPLNTIVFKNLTPGHDEAITIAGLQVTKGNNNLGFTNFVQGADATHNTGQITISSDTTFDLSTPTVANDVVLNRLGLGFGALSGYSDKDDGLFYSTDGTGEGLVSFGATPAFIGAGDLTINGQDIFTIPTAILKNDRDNALLDAINAQTATTGVQATRGADGVIRLAAIDGRNIHLETSTNGEAITHLTGGSRDQISFGSLQLRSDRKFILETVEPTINSEEPGLAALGLAGGETVSGETNDLAGDGKIDVFSLHHREGSVRYAGDRVNDLEIKIGKTTTMTIGENGKTGVMDTTIFSALKALEGYLLGENFTTVTGIHSATDLTAPLNSRTTGLEPASLLPSEELFAKGLLSVTVTDHDYDPPRNSSLTIEVDPAVDTLESVTERLNGIPHLSASWTTDGRLRIESSDPGRYTIALADNGSNFLTATGVSPEFMQNQGITQSIANLDTLMENLTRQVSDFGARANRIDIQSQIYSTMTIATKENLSEVQDTDMIKAIMELKAKETAYQAALSAAAKTMQLSLVDYLR